MAGLDLDKWSVFIISDHGESWRSDEPYHGQSLRNDVLRVPLYYHIPGSGNPSPGRQLISLIDLFPTLLAQLGLRHTYRGFARDIHDSDTPGHYLAEIDPGPLAEAADAEDLAKMKKKKGKARKAVKAKKGKMSAFERQMMAAAKKKRAEKKAREAARLNGEAIVVDA